MTLIRRTWPYGTEYECKVISASRSLIMVHVPKTGEAFALVKHGVAALPLEGTKGKITFCQGGPTGGYWRFEQ